MDRIELRSLGFLDVRNEGWQLYLANWSRHVQLEVLFERVHSFTTR